MPETHMDVRAVTWLFCLALTLEVGQTLDLCCGNRGQLCHCSWKTFFKKTDSEIQINQSLPATCQQPFGKKKLGICQWTPSDGQWKQNKLKTKPQRLKFRLSGALWHTEDCLSSTNWSILAQATVGWQFGLLSLLSVLNCRQSHD